MPEETFQRYAAESLEFPRVQGAIAERCATEAGRELARNLSPLELPDALHRLTMTGELADLRREGTALPSGPIAAVERPLALLERGGEIGLEDVIAIRETVATAEKLRLFLSAQTEALPATSRHFAVNPSDLSSLYRLLADSLTPEGEINPAHYPEYRRLRNEAEAARKAALNHINRLFSNPNTEKHLQEKVYDTRGGRYVVLLKSSSRGAIRGTVHDLSASGNTLYLEPEELTRLNDAVAHASVELELEACRIVAMIAERIAAEADVIIAAACASAEFDCLRACARYMEEFNLAVPVIAEDKGLRLYAARHPLLAEKGSVVPNDIIIPEGTCGMIISGANAGGKTIALKTAGLAALMLRHGIPVPASPDSVMPFFTGVFADIGDDQSIDLSLSTFSGAMRRISAMMAKCDAHSLILIDEIISGTNPHYGSALARSILEHFAERGARVIVTTHYPELKTLAGASDKFINASVLFDTETLQPTYLLKSGIAGMSFTFEIAGLAGLPPAIVRRARELASAEELSFDALVEKLHTKELEMDAMRLSLSESRDELTRTQRRLDELEKNLKEEIRRARKGEAIASIEAMRNLRRELAEKAKSADGARRGSVTAEIDAALESVERELREIKTEELGTDYVRFDPAIHLPGRKVRVLSMDTDGELISVDARKATALVRVGTALKAQYSFDDLLAHPAPAPKPKQRKLESVTLDRGKAPLTVQTAENTIDLRGMRVEEALSTLDASLDAMVMRKLSACVIIHGHGTGAVKSAVRNALKYSHYVSSWRGGEPSEGADGVTIAVLR